MAELRELQVLCGDPDCRRMARVEVVDRWGEPHGVYCADHGAKVCDLLTRNDA